MNNAMTNGIGWHTRPLCRTYLLLLFETLSLQVNDGGPACVRALRWAFGVLPDGQHEVLGAWLAPEAQEAGWQEVFEDIKVRGVEKIGFVASNEPATVHAVVRAVYPSATSLPSIGQLLTPEPFRPRYRDPQACDVAGLDRAALAALAGVAVTRFDSKHPVALQRRRAAVQQLGSFNALPPRIRGFLLASEVTLQQLQRSASRAITRHGPFADGSAATALVVDALRLAERRFCLVDISVDVASARRADRAILPNTRFNSGAVGL